MLIWLLLYTQLALADDSVENSVKNPVEDQFCFSSPVKMKEASSRLKFLLLPVDVIIEEKDCFILRTQPHRRELLQNSIRRIDSGVQILSTTVGPPKSPCHIKVERQKANDSSSTSSSTDLELSATAAVEQSKLSVTEVMTIQTLKDFELAVNQDSIKGICRVVNNDQYNLEITIAKRARPIFPVSVSNVSVAVTDAQIVTVQETLWLKTNLPITRGQRIEIGSIIKNMTNNENRIETKSEASFENDAGLTKENVFISID